MICSSLNRDLFIPSVSFVGTDSTSKWKRKRVSGQYLAHWKEFIRSTLVSFGAIFLVLEGFEVLTDGNVSMHTVAFLALGLVPGGIYFLVDGYFIDGFLKREIEIPSPTHGTKIIVRFGDLFSAEGWKVIAVNDFFDSKVDEELISSRSLHGIVLDRFWPDDREDWERQVGASIRSINGVKDSRPKGNRIRYPIGTTARASIDDQKFLFVALGKADANTHETNATAESLICAVRGMVKEARIACSMEPLNIPLMGSGLSRVDSKSSVLLDLIITAVLEETRNGRVTHEIRILLHEDRSMELIQEKAAACYLGKLNEQSTTMNYR